MLNFLRQEIAKKEQERQKAFHAQDMESEQPIDDAILECAHLFNEMEELTIIGTNAQRERPVIDIPIEDDVELDLIEMDVNTGRIVDVPMDVQTSEAFSQEKTYENFYQEAMSHIPKFNRESDQSYHKRIQEAATKSYEAYHNYIIQEGLFGNDMMNISDERVPSTMMVDLGPIHEGSNRHFVTKLRVFFQITNDNKISMNQIHALNIANNLGAFEHTGEALRGLLIRDGFREQLYRNEIWDIATPIRIIVPQVHDRYSVGIEFDVDGLKNPYPLIWSIETRLVRQSKNGNIENKEELKKKMEGTEEHTYPNIKVAEKQFDKMKLVCKKDYKAKEDRAVEEFFSFTPNRWSGTSYYQEAIDFGGGDPAGGDPPPIGDPTAAGGDPSAVNTNAGGANTPPPATDPTATPDPNASSGTTETNPDASTATTNDISQQIADNVASATAANTAAASQTDVMNQNPTFDQNVDDTFAGLDDAMTGTDTTNLDSTTPDLNTTNPDAGTSTTPDPLENMGDTTTPTDPTNPASSLDDIETDIGDSGSDSSNDNKEMGGLDIDNMSMDDMIQQGIEKIKTMPMSQLKEFLNDGSGAIGTTPSDTDDELNALEQAVNDMTDEEFEVVLESAGSIKDELKNCVRKVLGDLNNEKMNLSEIFHSVKKDSKYLNNAIAKAIKSVEFDKVVKKELENLNHATNEMVLNLNDKPMQEEVENIKQSIKNFTNATRRISKVVEL